MTPSYFGRSGRALFGLYHPPAGRPARSRGVLLCGPMGHEGIRAHRALRQLALLLSRARYHVMRFDYFGCGDSYGDGADGHAAQWIEDIGTAAAELKDSAGVSKISLVGLRYGAALAAQAARGRRDLDCLVLWDPVVSGAEHLRELRAMHRELMYEEAGDRLVALDRLPAQDLPEEIMGFPLTRRCRRELEDLDLTTMGALPVRRVALVVSAPSDEYERLRLHLQGVRGPGADTTFSHVPAAWNSDAAMNHSLVPMDLLQAIVTSLSEASS